MAPDSHNQYGPHKPHQGKTWNKSWVSIGGILGAAILLSRTTRTPLASILGTLPFLMSYLKQIDAERETERARNRAPSQSSMTTEEASLILGITANASADDIKKAHRTLIQKNHPDQGGSDYLAAKINQARDVLLHKG